MRSAIPRSLSSDAIRPAWIVFPRPTSSAIRTRQASPRTIASAGSSWWGSSSMRACCPPFAGGPRPVRRDQPAAAAPPARVCRPDESFLGLVAASTSSKGVIDVCRSSRIHSADAPDNATTLQAAYGRIDTTRQRWRRVKTTSPTWKDCSIIIAAARTACRNCTRDRKCSTNVTDVIEPTMNWQRVCRVCWDERFGVDNGGDGESGLTTEQRGNGGETEKIQTCSVASLLSVPSELRLTRVRAAPTR